MSKTNKHLNELLTKKQARINKLEEKVGRLQRELEVNLAGVALALDLMEEIQQLRRRLQRLERGQG